MQWTYNPKLKVLAKELRQNMTLGEILVWQQIKEQQIHGYNFHRQKPIDESIIDFFCSELALAIEIDGATHDFKADSDHLRQKRLESLGIRIIRFTEKYVRTNLQGVMGSINLWIKENT